jgi:ribosomal protein S12 methylthiotransferase
MEFVKFAKIERMGAFTYSEEEGTYGALHFKDTVRESTKQRRYEELMELQSGISLEANEARVGSVERVIADSFTDGVLVCRSQGESPEVDGEILIGDLGDYVPEQLIGKFITAKITGANEYDLLAEIVAVE